MLHPPVIPPTPSPTFSGASLPSPPFPSTPSSSRSYQIPLPPAGPYGIVQQVHPAISYSSRIAPLHVDVTVSPSQLAVRFELSLLDEPVTYPHMTSVVLFSDLLPWSTRVEAQTPGGVVTIFDVLETLHTALRTPISKSEWNSLSSHTQNSVSGAFYHRLGGIRDHLLREKQLRKGVRRLDFLLGNTKLLGISAVADKPGVFTLYWGSAN
ncbi:hypothetical protein BJ322DRAFT_1007653 [Thelephora terrestris]|uniref:DUF6699 domain-containing protein n=1 Tax=Thelephora terrestris TaxID=56493 RepID=A0A9P6L630_9AGAM|nr:hypothetical protein BJ322DRAFT_1007653 [Thelephora terrestris]